MTLTIKKGQSPKSSCRLGLRIAEVSSAAVGWRWMFDEILKLTGSLEAEVEACKTLPVPYLPTSRYY